MNDAAEKLKAKPGRRIKFPVLCPVHHCQMDFRNSVLQGEWRTAFYDCNVEGCTHVESRSHRLPPISSADIIAN